MALAYVNEACRRHRSTWCRDDRCNPRSLYTREMVQALLTARWNDGLIPQDEVIEAGMPKAATNPATQGNAMVMLMDLERAWQAVRLHHNARAGLYLRYGHGWLEREIGAELGVTKQTISEHMEGAVGKLVHWLNGTEDDGESDTE